MSKKRLAIIIISAVVFIAFAVIGTSLLLRGGDKTASGAIYGTIVADNVEKPENLNELEFGITYTVAISGGAGSGVVKVKNGNNVTVTSEEGKKVEINIFRYPATSEFNPTTGTSGGLVYTEEIPTSLEWNMSDILSSVDWSDDYFCDKEVKTSYEVTYCDSCLGQYYTSQLNVSYTDENGETYYWTYLPGFSISDK